MRGAYAIARHEFLRRWPLILVGLALGLLTLAFAPTDALTLDPFVDMLATISVVVCWIVAFTTGMSIVGRPLHDGRLAFYFTRPIPSAGIVLGKIIGGLAAITCMHVLLSLPLARVFANVVDRGARDFAGAATLVGLAFFVVGLVVGILARSRSRWFVADILGAAVAALVAVLMFGGFGARKASLAQFMDDPFEAERLIHRADTFLYALAVAAAVVFVLSVVVAITRGRTDRVLVHRAISIVLWPALTAIGLAGLCLSQWGLG